MVTRRRASGSGKLEPSDARTRSGLAREIAQALNANLDRGFLESEERFRQMADTLHDIVFLTSSDLGAIQFVNAAYEEIWGTARAALYQNPLAFLDGVHPDDRQRVRDALTGHPGMAYDVEFRVVRPDGELRSVRARGFPVHEATGEITRMAGIAEDMTDHRRIMASHEQLIRGFTHDLKNPLGAADGHLSLLEDGVLGELTPVQVASIGRTRRSIRIALDLVVQLLDIERAQTGTLDLRRESFDLAVAIRDLVEESRAGASAKQLTLTLERAPPDAEALVVYSDPTRVRQIVTNLLSNAVKYTQPGGRCTVGARFVEGPDAPEPGRWVAIVVADNGPGVPIEKQHLLFREFARFSPNSAEGAGIGLAISQQLARALGGRIVFESIPGAGSTFTLWLPKDRRATSPDSESPRAALAGLTGT